MYEKLLLFNGNNGYVNAPQCYVIRTLPVFLCSLFEGFFDVFKRVVAFSDGVFPSAFLGVEPQNIIIVMQIRLLF
jgi:hypothetical protein